MTDRIIIGRDPATGAGVAVTIAEGMVVSIEPAREGGELYLSPGLIDLQVNGYGGLDFNAPDLSIEMVRELTGKLRAVGTSTFLPTLITAAEDQITRALRVIAEARRLWPDLRRAMPAVHLEGPSISLQDGPRGAHPKEHVRPPDVGEFDRWQQAAGGLIGVVTLSPEYDEAPAYIAALVRRGVHVALGHTAAAPEQVHAAADAGARLSTHLGNGTAAILPRHPNVIWAQLADDRLTACFIADGHHLPADTLKSMLRAKGIGRAVLVSDSVALAGMPPGRYHTPVGGEVEVVTDRRINVAGSPYLAGAGKPLIDGVAGAMRLAGLPLHKALRLATRNPGSFLGGLGQLEVGRPADLLLIRHDAQRQSLSLNTVFIGGVELTA